MPTILIIEDESAIADTLVYALGTEGFETRWERLGEEGFRLLQAEHIDLLILDVGLPDINGFELCKRIRGASDIPILFLTARSDEIDRIVGLEIGGDDYVTKPFSPREVAARVKVILRRRGRPSQPRSSGFELDTARQRVRLDGQRLELTRYEFLILQLLFSQPERVFSRAQIMDQVWDEPEAAFDRAVDTHIKTLRAKLREVRQDELIHTHRGLGYSLRLPDAS